MDESSYSFYVPYIKLSIDLNIVALKEFMNDTFRAKGLRRLHELQQPGIFVAGHAPSLTPLILSDKGITTIWSFF